MGYGGRRIYVETLGVVIITEIKSVKKKLKENEEKISVPVSIRIDWCFTYFAGIARQLHIRHV